jgi:hypothetical protein
MYGQGQAMQPPRRANTGAVVALRVLFTALPVVTIGFLACGSMLRLALVFRRAVDWALFAVVLGMDAVALACFAASDDDNDWQANTGGTLLVLCIFGVAVYFLISDIVRKRPAPYPPQQWVGPVGYPGMQQNPHPNPGTHPNANPYATGIGAAGPLNGPGPLTGPGVRPVQQGYTGRQYQPPGPHTPATPMTSIPPHIPSSGGASTPPPARPPVSGQAAPSASANPVGPSTPAPGPAAATPAPAPRIDQVRAELDELSDYLRKERGDGRDSGEGGR